MDLERDCPRFCGGRNHGLRERQRHEQAEGLPDLPDCGAGQLELEQSWLCHDRRGGVLSRLPNPSDNLMDLIHATKSVYRQNGTFVMNRKTQGVIRKLKDTTGSYLWQPPTVAGGRSTLMNFPVVEAEDMPDIAANSLSIAFGDFQRGYVVVDRIGIRTMRDPFSTKPYVIFYTTKRVGGGVQDFDAIKLLRFSV